MSEVVTGTLVPGNELQLSFWAKAIGLGSIPSFCGLMQRASI